MMAAPPFPRAPARRARVLLAVGAVIGLAAGVAAALRPGALLGPGLDEQVAAVVGDAPIETRDLERAIELLAADRRTPISDRDRAHVLDRLIDEELLVQRARELGLDQHDRRVRSLLVQTLVDSIVADARQNEPSEAEVAAFYKKNSAYFARSDRLRVRALRFAPRGDEDDRGALRRATSATALLRQGTEAAAVERDLADPWVVPPPDALLPPTKLREYLGPTAARRALELSPGEASEPLRGLAGWTVLVMLERSPAEFPPLSEVEEQVRSEMRRQAGDQALRGYLDDLRQQTDVRVRAGATSSSPQPSSEARPVDAGGASEARTSRPPSSGSAEAARQAPES